jgi:hypothetical protein
MKNSSKTNSWWHILLVGLLLFVVGVVVFAVTGNPNLFPTVTLIGNLLVPVSYVAFFYERRHLSQVTLVSVAQAFFYGGCWVFSPPHFWSPSSFAGSPSSRPSALD